MNQTISKSILWPAEKFVNMLMENDSHLKKYFAGFHGKSIEIESFSPKLDLTIKFYDDRISLIAFRKEFFDTPADVKISGEFYKLLRVLIDREKHGFFNQNIKVTGDAELVQKLYDILLKLDIDWLDLLTPWLGHVLTNEIHKGGRRAIDCRDQVTDSLNRNLQDYLKEEKRFLPSSNHLESLKDDIDLLKLRVDRVMAKTQLLTESLNKPDVNR